MESSRLWEQHHDAMTTAMATHDDVVRTAVETRQGVLVKQTGDGAFAAFSSAFDAIDAAVAITDGLADLSWDGFPSLRARIGIHTGEAELRDGDYYGGAVNRAARVMAIAAGGEVLLSRATQEVVRDRVPDGLVLRDLGERDLRGLSRPEHVFRLTDLDRTTPSVAEGLPTGTDDQARRAAWIAVLPFDNLSADPDQQYFADGIAEDVITGLAAFRSLRVIARTSSFRYRDSDASIVEIADELGVGFVLEGSVRKAGERARVTAQLIAADGRHHIWADHYDTDLSDIFDVQDQITHSIVVAIDPAIRIAEVERAARDRPTNLDAWSHVQRGWSALYRYKRDAAESALEHFAVAAALDEESSQAKAGMAYAHGLQGWLLWADDPRAALQQAYEEAKQATELDERDALAHGAVAFAAYGLGRMDQVIEAAGHAVDLNPSLPVGYLWGGIARVHGGSDPEAGIRMITRAIELSPRDPMVNWFYGGRAIGHFVLHQLDEAIADARTAIKIRYGYLFARVVLTAALAEQDRRTEAQQELQAILELRPDFSPAFLDLYTFSNEADRERLIAGLRSAGLTTSDP